MTVLKQLQEALSERYSFHRAIGEGGMAFVYEATDLKHGRKVAFKVLRPEVSSDLGSERFLREIKIVARLSHPHVLPLHDSGEVDGILYYVMPLVTGENLRERLHREPALSLDEQLRIFREVAQALSYAHGEGVIHRDLKPANIMLSDGVAVVTDFGIARAHEFSGSEQLTHVGLAIGTPAYMSPEQATGESTPDARSDVYSLGCILHELVTGNPPYAGSSALALIAKHAAEPVPDLEKTHAGVSPVIARAVKRALAKDPADRFSSVEEFAKALVGVASTARTATWPVNLTGLSKYVRVAGIAALIAIAALGAWAYWRPQPALTAPRLVVLPFEHIGPDNEKYLADGITDEISNRIAEVSGISVVSRTSAMQFAFPRNTLKEIASKLNVSHVLYGTVQTDRGPDGTPVVRVRPKLVEVRTEREIPAFDERNAKLVLGQLFEVQREIATGVVNGLSVALSPEALEALASRPTENLQAYNAYLRGINHASQFLVRNRQVQAIEMFEEAVRLDPQFALAYARLAQVQAQFYTVFDRTPERMRRWQTAVDRATELRPALSQTKVARGQWFFYAKQDAAGAMREIEDVRRRQPNNTQLLWLLARIQRTRGDFAGALKSFDEVAALDPRSATFPFEAATALTMLGRFDEALTRVNEAAALDPDWLPPRASRARLMEFLGRAAEAKDTLQQMVSALPTLLPQFISEPLYRDLWEWLYPEDFQRALERVSLPESRSDSAEYYHVKGALFRRRGDTKRQVAYFDSALRVLSGRRARGASGPFILVDLGSVSLGAGHRDQARLYADSAWAADVLKTDAFRGWFATMELARLYARIGAKDKALDVLESVKARGRLVPPALLREDAVLSTLSSERRLRALMDSA